MPCSKEYRDHVVQELHVQVETLCFRREVYYSPAPQRTFTAPLPPGYHGAFGPGVRSLALWLVYAGGMSQPQVHALFTDAGLLIAAGTVSALLTQGLDAFHAEAQAVCRAGLASSPWQNLDETPTPVDGVRSACHTLGNPLYAFDLTTPKKDRLAALDVLRGGQPRAFRLDATAWASLERVGVAQKVIQQLRALPKPPEPAGPWDEATFLALLAAALLRAGPQ
jgi:hypothetical protein